MISPLQWQPDQLMHLVPNDSKELSVLVCWRRRRHDYVKEIGITRQFLS
jgi:hypothetical protein